MLANASQDNAEMLDSVDASQPEAVVEPTLFQELPKYDPETHYTPGLVTCTQQIDDQVTIPKS